MKKEEKKWIAKAFVEFSISNTLQHSFNESVSFFCYLGLCVVGYSERSFRILSISLINNNKNFISSRPRSKWFKHIIQWTINIIKIKFFFAHNYKLQHKYKKTTKNDKKEQQSNTNQISFCIQQHLRIKIHFETSHWHCVLSFSTEKPVLFDFVQLLVFYTCVIRHANPRNISKIETLLEIQKLELLSRKKKKKKSTWRIESVEILDK